MYQPFWITHTGQGQAEHKSTPKCPRIGITVYGSERKRERKKQEGRKREKREEERKREAATEVAVAEPRASVVMRNKKDRERLATMYFAAVCR